MTFHTESFVKYMDALNTTLYVGYSMLIKCNIYFATFEYIYICLLLNIHQNLECLVQMMLYACVYELWQWFDHGEDRDEINIPNIGQKNEKPHKTTQKKTN